jgi:hypothetical protein
VRRLAVTWAFGAFLATVALLIARAAAPGRSDLELDVYVLALGVMALLAIMSWLRELVPLEGRSALEEALDREPPQPPGIPELARLEREVYVGAARTFDLHYRLRPVLREIAAARLEKRGLRLDSGDAEVRELLGEELWDLTRPDREPPIDRHGPGPGLERVGASIARLEAI